MKYNSYEYEFKMPDSDVVYTQTRTVEHPDVIIKECTRLGAEVINIKKKK